MSKLLTLAMQELGVKEISGPEDNPTIVNYAKESGFDWVNDDETPWCSIFVNWCAKKANLKGTNKANARSWLTIGSAVDFPELGDVVVYWRGSVDSWQGHVGFFIGYDQSGDRIYTLGGNQGNQVSITAYPASKLLGFRRLGATSTYTLPQPVLKEGDTGKQVMLLQDSLKLVGFNPGTSDGVFGAKTTLALKPLLQ
tara:strand:- start:3741 stop:4331 length:591 start_codon:yes stop_codon:yes gene_type:complete